MNAPDEVQGIRWALKQSFTSCVREEGSSYIHSVGPGGFKIAFSEGGWGGWVACSASLKVGLGCHGFCGIERWNASSASEAMNPYNKNEERFLWIISVTA